MEAAYRGDTLKARASSDFCFWNFNRKIFQETTEATDFEHQLNPQHSQAENLKEKKLKLTQVKEAVEKGADVDAADAYGPGPYFPSAICSISGELKEPDIRWMRYDKMNMFTIFP